MSSQGCSLISHLLNSTSRTAAPRAPLLGNWFASDSEEEKCCTQLHMLFILELQLLFNAWGFFCAITKPGLALLSLRSASMTARGDANRVLLSKTKCIRTAFFFSFSLSPFSQRDPTLLLCHIGLCWEKVTSVTHVQSAEPPLKMNALVLSFQSCLWSLHVPVPENTLQMLRLHSYEQWYWLAWAVCCNHQHRIWGL